MPNSSDEFREQLLGVESMTPGLRESYQKEINAMMNPPMTWRSAAPAGVMMIILVACVVGIIRTFIVHPPGLLTGAAWAMLASTFSWVSFMIVRDLWRKKHSRKSAYSISWALYGTAGMLTVVALIHGMRAPSDPASTFKAFYVFVFYAACGAMSFEHRIAAAELATREHLLRLESRMVDLMDRVAK